MRSPHSWPCGRPSTEPYARVTVVHGSTASVTARGTCETWSLSRHWGRVGRAGAMGQGLVHRLEARCGPRDERPAKGTNTPMTVSDCWKRMRPPAIGRSVKLCRRWRVRSCREPRSATLALQRVIAPRSDGVLVRRSVVRVDSLVALAAGTDWAGSDPGCRGRGRCPPKPAPQRTQSRGPRKGLLPAVIWWAILGSNQ